MTDHKIELPEGIPSLSTYYVYLTGGCNLACKHCWLAPTYQANGGTGGHLDYDLFSLAIEEGLPLGLKNLKLTGGEPLLHPEFIRILDLIKEKELGLTIETNGVLMTQSLAHYLKEKSTLKHISVSLDGATATTHDPFRGVKGSFDKAVQGIHYLVDAGFRPQVIMSIHVGNVNEVEELVQLAEKSGAGSVKFNLIQPAGRGEIMAERGQVLDIKRLIDVGNWVEKELQKRTSISLHYSWPMAFYSIQRLMQENLGICGINNILGILASGQMAMCGIGIDIPELSYGQLGVNRVSDVWCTHPMLLSLREDIPNELEGICADCMFKRQCLGSCVANNFHQSHRLTSTHWFCQSAKESGLFPLSRLITLHEPVLVSNATSCIVPSRNV